MKKIGLIIICVSIQFTNCQGKTSSDNSLIDNFINKIVLNYDACLNYGEISNYILVNEDYLVDIKKKQFLINLIQQRIIELRMGLNEKDDNYKIVSHKEFKQLDINFNFKYKNLSKVYYIVSGKDVLTTFVISEGKIISFFYGLIKKESHPRVPWILN